MIKIKFKNKDDEIKFFTNLNKIKVILGIKIRYAMMISDLDVSELEEEDV